MAEQNVQRLPAEELYQKELDALIAADTDPVPTGWRMSPRAVLTYITGGTSVKGVEISPKYMGNRRLVEIAIATLITDRALLLIGEPGTAKSWSTEIPQRSYRARRARRKNISAIRGTTPC